MKNTIFITMLVSIALVFGISVANSQIWAQTYAQNGTDQTSANGNATGIKVQIATIKNEQQATSVLANALHKLTAMTASASTSKFKPLVTGDIIDRNQGTSVIRSENSNVIMNILHKEISEELAAGHQVLLVCPIHGNWVHFDLFID